MRGMHTVINRKEGVVGFGESDLCYKNMRRDHSCHLGLVFWDKGSPLKSFSSCHISCFSSLLWYFDRYARCQPFFYLYYTKQTLMLMQTNATCILCGLKVPVAHVKQYFSDKWHLQSHVSSLVLWFMAL